MKTPLTPAGTRIAFLTVCRAPPDLADCAVVLESPGQESPTATVWGADPANLALATPHVNTPCQWFNPLAANRANVTICLDARTYPHTQTDTLIATLPGASDEVMAIGSHTDDVNIVGADEGAERRWRFGLAVR